MDNDLITNFGQMTVRHFNTATVRRIPVRYEPSISEPEMAMGKDLNTGRYIVTFRFFEDGMDD